MVAYTNEQVNITNCMEGMDSSVATESYPTQACLSLLFSW
jgi:hypothetical protein